MENLKEVCQCSRNNNELPTIPPQSSFQLEPGNCNRQSVILEDAQVPKKAWDQLFPLLQNTFDSIVPNHL